MPLKDPLVCSFYSPLRFYYLTYLYTTDIHKKVKIPIDLFVF